MKLSLLYEGVGQYVYHRTNSFHSLYNLLTSGELRSLVTDWDDEIGKSRLSATMSLDESKRSWDFGPYIVEILIHGASDHPQWWHKDFGFHKTTTEFVVSRDTPFSFTRWGIDFAPMSSEGDQDPENPRHDIKWFNIDEVRSFDHRLWDGLVLRSFREGAVELGFCWAKDFMDGDWPGVTDVMDIHRSYGYFLNDYRNLPPEERKQWGVHFRKSLYGLDDEEDEEDEDEEDGEYR